MAQEFEIGSIADLVNKSGTKIKKNKKMAKAEVETPVVTPKKRLSKRKSSEFEVTDVEPENDSSKVISKKTKKIKKLDVTAEPEAEVAAPTPKKKNKKKKPNVSQEAISPKVENTKNVSNDEGSQEKLTRTVFIGNLPANFHLKDLKKKLQEHGKVLSIRVRSVAPAKISLSKKAAFLSKQINANKKTVNAYVVFKESSSIPEILKLNGTMYEGNYIQVDKVEENPSYDSNLSLFLGNLSFKTTDNEVREFFQDCGEIQRVRLIRDSKTGIGKGFGYVTFASNDSLVMALEKNGQALNGREIRIKSYKYSPQPKDQSGESPKKAKRFQKATKAPKPKADSASFKGQMASKKVKAKNSIKVQVKSRKIKKEKKKVSEILGK